MQNHNYYVFILTNKHKTVLYTGVTNDLSRRLNEHAATVNVSSFTAKYNVFYLIYFERFQNHAILLEKEIKGWRRRKKIELINTFNPEWKFLNDTIQ